MLKSVLLSNLEKLHTTAMGSERIKRNLFLDTDDAAAWCKRKIQTSDFTIEEKGKNWYVFIEDCIITINKHSYTIITAHKLKDNLNRIRSDKQSNKEIVFEFVSAINRQDVAAIISLMSDDFLFVDTYGESADKQHMRTGWPGYFEWFPDYIIDINEYLENKNCSVIMGKASASYLGNKEKSWEFPAAWKVIVHDGQIKLWQVFCDSKKQLDSMR